MNNKKVFLKKILSYFPFFNKIIRKIYNHYTYGTFFIPFRLNADDEGILKSKSYKLNNKNFEKFKNKYDHFIVSEKKVFSDYSKGFAQYDTQTNNYYTEQKRDEAKKIATSNSLQLIPIKVQNFQSREANDY